MIKNAFREKKNRYIKKWLILTIFVATIWFVCILFDNIETNRLEAYVDMNIEKSENIMYKTKKLSVKISEKVSQKLRKSGTTLIIYNESSEMTIKNAKAGRIWLPYKTYKIVKLDGEYTKMICIKNPSCDNVEKVTYYGDKAVNSLNEIFDLYVCDNGIFRKQSSFELQKGLNIDSKETYFTYIPIKDFSIGNIETLKGDIAIPTMSLYPQNATNIDIDYIQYNNKILEIVDQGILAKEVADTDIVIRMNGIEKSIHVSIKQPVEEIKLNKTKITLALNNWAYVIAEAIPNNAVNEKLIWTTSDENVATVEDGMIKPKGIGRCEIIVSTISGPKVTNTIQVNIIEKPEYCQNKYGYPETIIEGPYYKDGILIVNKKFSIPCDFATSEDKVALEALEKLQKAAHSEGVTLPNISGFRSYYSQKALYDWYISVDGEYLANTYSARPGHSEHSTGLAFDVGEISSVYGLTKSGKWLSENAHKYGFIIRYPQGKSDITGYKYEPWHIRYLGIENAIKVHNSGKTLEEYLNLVY